MGFQLSIHYQSVCEAHVIIRHAVKTQDATKWPRNQNNRVAFKSQLLKAVFSRKSECKIHQIAYHKQLAFILNSDSFHEFFQNVSFKIS